MKLKNKKFVIFFIISVLLISIFSFSTSFLYPDCYVSMNHTNSIVHLLIGKGISQGYMPYSQLFGDSGVLLYFINSIGYFLHIDQLFVFLLQILNLTFILWFIDKILSLFTNYHLSLTLLSLFPIVATISAGNGAEEYCLLWILISIYLTLKVLLKEKHDSIKIYGILGLCFSLVFYIKFIYSILVLFCLIILLFYSKEKIISKIVLFLTPFSIISLFIIIYFTNYNALNDMIYGFFILPCYSLLKGCTTFNEVIRKLIKLLPVILLLGVVLKNKSLKKGSKSFLIGLSLLLIVLLFLGQGYWNYYFIICFIVPLTLGIQLDNQTYKPYMSLFIIVLMGIYCIPFKNTMIQAYQCINHEYLEYNQELKILHNDLEDNDSVILLDVDPSYYLINEYMPKIKYFCMQTELSKLDMRISSELLDEIENSEETWLIISTKGIVNECYGSFELYDMQTNSHNEIIYRYINISK